MTNPAYTPQSVRVMHFGLVAGGAAAILLTSLLCLGAPLPAQSALKPFRVATKPDEINLVVSAVVKDLSYDVAASMSASTAKAWRIEVPDSTRKVWKDVRDGLSAILHARAVRPSDSSYQTIAIHSSIVRGDTLFASYSTSTEWYCALSPNLVIPKGGGWTGSSSETNLVAVRQGKYWSTPTVLLGLTTDGGCMYKSSPLKWRLG